MDIHSLIMPYSVILCQDIKLANEIKHLAIDFDVLVIYMYLNAKEKKTSSIVAGDQGGFTL